jgi:hypothetical protein
VAVDAKKITSIAQRICKVYEAPFATLVKLSGLAVKNYKAFTGEVMHFSIPVTERIKIG